MGLLKDLTTIEKQVVLLNFGFIDNIEYRQNQICQIINISQPYVSRIMKTALTKLQIKVLDRKEKLCFRKVTNNDAINKNKGYTKLNDLITNKF